MALRTRFLSASVLVLCGFLLSSLSGESALAASLQPPGQPSFCDPFINAIASLVFPGWGQYLNNEPIRKVLIHITLGLGLTLAIIYFWKKLPEGNFARLGRLLWSIYSGLDAYNVCYARAHPSS